MTGKRSDPSYDYPPLAQRTPTVMAIHLTVWFDQPFGGEWLPVGSVVKTGKLRNAKHSCLALSTLYGHPVVVGTFPNMSDAGVAVRNYARRELA